MPPRIGFGGAQRLTVHRLPGGTRVIDAMGPDDAAIALVRRLFGADAADRARALDVLRADGQPLSLAWDAFAYLVLIAQFEASYERPNWVPYRMACTVLADQTQVAAEPAMLLVTTVVADLAAAVAVNTAAAATALVVAVMTLGTAAYGAAVAAVGAAQTAATSGMTSAGTALLAAGDPVSAATAARQLAQLADAGGSPRASANLANATS